MLGENEVFITLFSCVKISEFRVIYTIKLKVKNVILIFNILSLIDINGMEVKRTYFS